MGFSGSTLSERGTKLRDRAEQEGYVDIAFVCNGTHLRLHFFHWMYNNTDGLRLGIFFSIFVKLYSKILSTIEIIIDQIRAVSCQVSIEGFIKKLRVLQNSTVVFSG